MMIDAVMYGMIPRAKMANWLSAPPENRLRKPSVPWVSAAFWSCFTAWKSTPGTGIEAPSR